MSRRRLIALPAVAIMGLALPPGGAVAQQAGPTVYRYFTQAALTDAGVKDLQNHPPTAVRAGIAKFAASMGGTLEGWYFNDVGTTGYGIIDYPNQITTVSAPITITVTINGADVARVTMTPLITAEDADKAVAKILQPQ